MSGKDADVRSQQEQEIERLARELEESAQETQRMRDQIAGFLKLARVGGSMLRQFGKNEMDPDDLATRLQAALEGRAPDTAVHKDDEGRRTRVPTFSVRDPREMAMHIGEHEEHLRSHPNDRRALLMLARLYECVGRRADAIVRYRELAGWYVGEEKHLKAVAVLKHALGLNAEDITARQNLAYILAEKLALLPDAVREYQQCAILSKQAGDTAGYLVALRDAFRWDMTDDPDIRRTLLHAYGDAGRAEEGLRIVKDSAPHEQIAVKMVDEIIGALGDSTDVPRLRVMNGPDEGTYLQIADFDTEYIIGRGRDYDLVLRNDPFIGEEHAAVRRTRAGVSLSARSGHRVGVGERMFGDDGESGPLRDKDEIRIGATTLVFMDMNADETISGRFYEEGPLSE